MGPAQHVAGFVFGHAEQAADHPDRHRLAILCEQIDRLIRGQLRQILEQGCANLLNIGHERGDPAGGKGAQHKAAQTPMARPFQFEHGMIVDIVKGPQMRGDIQRKPVWGLPPKTIVAQGHIHTAEPRDNGQGELIPIDHAARGAQSRVKRVGILYKLGLFGRLGTPGEALRG